MAKLLQIGSFKTTAALAIGILGFSAQLGATPVLHDKGIEMAGPFAVPDIGQPPTVSSEATFVAGSISAAPLYLNEFVVSSDGASGAFSNNGWVIGDPFTIEPMVGGAILSLTWDLTGTHYAVTHVSVNFDNNFYHVYTINIAQKNDSAVFITGNQRDPISQVRFFGVRVADSDATVLLFGISMIAILGLGLKRVTGASRGQRLE